MATGGAPARVAGASPTIRAVSGSRDGLRDPSADTVVPDKDGRWRIAVGGNPDELMMGLWWPSEELARLHLRRKQAIYDGDFDRLAELDAKSAELRRPKR